MLFILPHFKFTVYKDYLSLELAHLKRVREASEHRNNEFMWVLAG